MQLSLVPLLLASGSANVSAIICALGRSGGKLCLGSRPLGFSELFSGILIVGYNTLKEGIEVNQVERTQSPSLSISKRQSAGQVSPI